VECQYYIFGFLTVIGTKKGMREERGRSVKGLLMAGHSVERRVSK
jgi:hypothetical protein